MGGQVGCRLGGRVYELKKRLKSASVEVEVEIEAKLGKRGAYCDIKGFNVLYLAMKQQYYQE